MLLPSTAANPASMMGQALSIYKSLLGNASGDKSFEVSQPALKDTTKNSPSEEYTDENLTSSRKMTNDAGRFVEPGFSLQSPNKEH